PLAARQQHRTAEHWFASRRQRHETSCQSHHWSAARVLSCQPHLNWTDSLQAFPSRGPAQGFRTDRRYRPASAWFVAVLLARVFRRDPRRPPSSLAELDYRTDYHWELRPPAFRQASAARTDYSFRLPWPA